MKFLSRVTFLERNAVVQQRWQVTIATEQTSHVRRNVHNNVYSKLFQLTTTSLICQKTCTISNAGPTTSRIVYKNFQNIRWNYKIHNAYAYIIQLTVKLAEYVTVTTEQIIDRTNHNKWYCKRFQVQRQRTSLHYISR